MLLKAQSPLLGPAIREGDTAEKGYPSPLPVCKETPIQLRCWGHSQVKQSQLSLGSKRRDFLSSPPLPTPQTITTGPRLQGPEIRHMARWCWGKAEKEVSWAWFTWQPPGKRAIDPWRPLSGCVGETKGAGWVWGQLSKQ